MFDNVKPENITEAIESYRKNRPSTLSFWSRWLDPTRGLNRASFYLQLLNSPDLKPLEFNIIIYALLASADGNTLQEHVLKKLGYKDLGDMAKARLTLMEKIKDKINIHHKNDHAAFVGTLNEVNQAIGKIVKYANSDTMFPTVKTKEFLSLTGIPKLNDNRFQQNSINKSPVTSQTVLIEELTADNELPVAANSHSSKVSNTTKLEKSKRLDAFTICDSQGWYYYDSVNLLFRSMIKMLEVNSAPPSHEFSLLLPNIQSIIPEIFNHIPQSIRQQYFQIKTKTPAELQELIKKTLDLYLSMFNGSLLLSNFNNEDINDLKSMLGIDFPRIMDIDPNDEICAHYTQMLFNQEEDAKINDMLKIASERNKSMAQKLLSKLNDKPRFNNIPEEFTFVLHASSASHSAMYACNCRGEILIIDTLGLAAYSNYIAFNNAAIQGMTEALEKHKIPVHQDNIFQLTPEQSDSYLQKDGSICSGIAFAMAIAISFKKSFKEQLERLKNHLSKLCGKSNEHYNEIRTEHEILSKGCDVNNISSTKEFLDGCEYTVTAERFEAMEESLSNSTSFGMR